MRLAAFVPTWYIVFWACMAVGVVIVHAALVGVAVYWAVKWAK